MNCGEKYCGQLLSPAPDSGWKTNFNIYSNRYISIGERSCPLDYYYNYGYNVDTDNVLNLDLALEQKLDFITRIEHEYKRCL